MDDTNLNTAEAHLSNLRTVIAGSDAQVREALHSALTGDGHRVLAEAESVTSVLNAFSLSPNEIPHAVLVEAELPEGGGARVARDVMQMHPTTAVVLFTGNPRFRLADEDITCVAGLLYLPEPAAVSDLVVTAVRVAVARCGDLHVARRARTEAEERLEARKLVERAKGMLMRRTGCEEREAYRMLQRASQDGRKPMVDIARTVIAGG